MSIPKPRIGCLIGSVLFSILVFLLVAESVYLNASGQSSAPNPSKTNPDSRRISSPGQSPLTPFASPTTPHDDPVTDGWTTEAFAFQADFQLGKLAKIIGDPQQIEPSHLVELVTSDFSAGALRPDRLEHVYRDGLIRVARPAANGDARHDTLAPAVAMEGAVNVLQVLADGFGDLSEVRVEFHLFRIDRDADTWITRVFASISGQTQNGSREEHAQWTVVWRVNSIQEAPLIKSIEVIDFEQSQIMGANSTLFTDCTGSTIAGDTTLEEQLRYGHYHWMGRIENVYNVGLLGHTGLALGDVNGDRLDDLYLCRTGGLPNLLLVQNSDGTVTNRAREAGVDWLEHSGSALLVDLDNDNDQDLVLGTAWSLLIMSNDGTGRFDIQAEFRVRNKPTSIAAADYDNDGDLDLYICFWSHQPPIPYHDAANGAANILARNDGDWQFANVTVETGMDQNNQRFSFACSWEDMDNDGDQDLYVANDYGRNNLYRNDGDRFVDIAQDAGVEDIAAGMSVTWADCNHDGWMDLYVSNMFSAAGNRITYQRKFKQNAAEATRAVYQRHVRGNSLFQNSGDGTFRDLSEQAGVTLGRWAWGSYFVDLNNDGNEDLVVCNGYVTNHNPHDL